MLAEDEDEAELPALAYRAPRVMAVSVQGV